VAAILVVAVVSPRLDDPEWAHRAASAGVVVAIGAAEIGAVVTGKAGTGMAETGAANGMVTIGGIRTANGVGGMATGGVIPDLVLSSLAILAFRGGGVGAGVHGRAAGDILTGTTAMATRTPATVMAAMAMVTTVTVTATVTAMAAKALTANTALPLGPEWLSYSADSPVPAIIAGQSMESWGLRRGGQFEPTSKITDT
jgi:hypothetical protein